jgi:hypothetical protein
MSTDVIFFNFNVRKRGFISKKNMKIPSLHNSDGIGECPMTCENFFELP